MSAKERMLSYLPPEKYMADRVMQSVFDAQGFEIDALSFTLDEILEQYFINRATWGLRIWEEQYGLPINEGLDPEVRRRQIMARKRRGRNSLLKILQAVEPTLSLAWDRLILPFTLSSEADIYDFSPLIALLERHKPAHVSYSFDLVPSSPESGYTVYANHYRRNRIKMELLAGTAMAGRWPWWSTAGTLQTAAVNIQATPVLGVGVYDPSGTLYSGPVRGRVNLAHSALLKPSVAGAAKTFASPFFFSGIHRSGEVPVVTNEGSRQNFAIYFDNATRTGQGVSYPCGAYRCGEEVA